LSALRIHSAQRDNTLAVSSETLPHFLQIAMIWQPYV
jgi:hypothetical protein